MTGYSGRRVESSVDIWNHPNSARKSSAVKTTEFKFALQNQVVTQVRRRPLESALTRVAYFLGVAPGKMRNDCSYANFSYESLFVRTFVFGMLDINVVQRIAQTGWALCIS
eukprot:1744912-Pyramimonas_sp.AAC.2